MKTAASSGLLPLLAAAGSDAVAMRALTKLLESLPVAVSIHDMGAGFPVRYANPAAKWHATSLSAPGVRSVLEQARASGLRVTIPSIEVGGRRYKIEALPLPGPAGSSGWLGLIAEEKARAVSRLDFDPLMEITQAIWRPMPASDLAMVAAEQTERLIPGSQAAVALVPTEHPDLFRVAGVNGEWAETLFGLEFAAIGSLSGMAMKTRRALETTDLAAVMSVPDPVGPAMAHTVRVVPLTTGEPLPDGREALGTLAVYRPGRKPLTAKQRRLLDEFGRRLSLALHRAELLATTTRAARRLQIGLELAIDLAGSLETQEVVDRLVQRAAAALEADRATLLSVEDGWTVTEGSYDSSGQTLPVGSRFKITIPQFKRMLATMEPLVEAYDLTLTPRPVRDQLADVRHTVTMPLVLGGRVVACLAVSRRTEDAFSSEDIAILRQIATVAGLALRNARLYADLEHALERAASGSRRLRVGVEVAMDLGSLLDPDQVALGLLARATAAVGADRASLGRIEGGELVVDYSQAARGEPTPAGYRHRIADVDILQAAVQNRQPVQGRPPIPTMEGFEHFVAVPLTFQGEVVAILGASRVEGQPFTEEDIATLQQVGSVAVLALRNARMYKGQVEFMNMAAHELRTPLTVVNGYLSMFSDGSLGPPSDAWLSPLATMQEKAGELSTLVDDLLMGARLESGTLRTNVVQLDLREIGEAAARRARPRALMLEGRVGSDLPGLPVPVVADPEHLARVLDNLLNNALSYCDGPPSAMVRVLASGPGGRPAVVVEDGGRGIPAEFRERIFEQFFRIDESGNRSSGTGLGLYIARQLAQRSGGTLSLLRGAPGAGSAFIVELPPG